MSLDLNLSAVQRLEFDNEVKHAYRMDAGLRSCVTTRTNVQAGTYDFRAMGAGLAKQKATQDDVIPMNVSHTVQLATLQNWHAAEYTDIFAAAGVNFDEQRELAKVIAGSIRRREDQIIIDALDLAASTFAVPTSIGGTSTNLNVDKLRRASKLMNANGVPKGDRYYACNATGLESLLGTTQATSSDYNGVKALVGGDIDTFMGFKFVIVPDQTEGGLALVANDRHTFAWHKDSMGLAIGLDKMVTVDWVPTKTSWLACQTYKAGAVARDGAAANAAIRGIVEIALFE